MNGWKGHVLAAFVGIVFTGAVAAMLFVWRDFPMVARQAAAAEAASTRVAESLAIVAQTQVRVVTQLSAIEHRVKRVEGQQDRSSR